MTAPGALLFGRYAFPPNQLGYCGPEDHTARLQYVAEKTVDRGLVELERRFEGAYPYLCLIAEANRIGDPFDERVVGAYWIGNELLERVEARPLHDSLRARFAPRMRNAEFGWLAAKLEYGARPHHNFHVFDVYVRAGLMNDERATIALETMDMPHQLGPRRGGRGRFTADRASAARLRPGQAGARPPRDQAHHAAVRRSRVHRRRRAL